MVTDTPDRLPLTALANANGLTLTELAARMGVARITLQTVQRRGLPPRDREAEGVGRPNVVTLGTIAAALGLDVAVVEFALAPLCDRWRERVTDKREALLADLLGERPRESVAYVLGALKAGCRRFTRTKRPDHYALVTPSARPDCPAGHWQVTRFDDDGPMGHSFGAPMEGVARELRDHGFTVPAPDQKEVKRPA